MLCFSGCSDAFTTSNLPSSAFSGIAIFPYWDDLFVSSKTWQGIYYATQGTKPNRILIFEYYLSHYNAPTNYTHFQISFFENNPNLVQITYFEVDDLSATSTVGIQGMNIPLSLSPSLSLDSSSVKRRSIYPLFVQTTKYGHTEYGAEVHDKRRECCRSGLEAEGNRTFFCTEYFTVSSFIFDGGMTNSNAHRVLSV